MQSLPGLPSLWWTLALLPLAVAATYHRPAWLVPLLFVAGAMWITLRAGLLLGESLPADLEGRDLVIEGHIADLPQATDYGYRFPFDVEAAGRDGEAAAIPSRVLLSGRIEGEAPRAGERWRLRVRLTRPHGFQNPGGFDYEAYLLRNRLRAKGYVRAWLERLPAPSARYAVDRVRERLGERIGAALAEHPQAGIVVALANGNARGVGARQWDVLRRTGTMHLVAISGLHISLIGGIAFLVVRFLWALPGYTVLRLPAPVAGAIGALLAAAGYAALAGFVVPAQRALIMLAVAMTGIALRRRYLPSELLAAALLAVLVYDPLAVMATGFWLSFAAVAVILFAMHGPHEAWWRKWGYLQVAIALGLLPLSLWLFQQVSVIGPLANMVAVPVFDLLVVPLVLLGIVLTGFGAETLPALLYSAAAALLEFLWPLLQWLAELPWGQWWQHRPPVWALVAAPIGIALLLAPRGWPARWVGAVWLLPLVLVRPPAPAPGEVWFTLLDVGQGLAAVVRTHGHTLVYDAGPRFSESFDTGESVVVPYLRHEGVRRIDRLIVSHGDNDHAGGAGSVLAAMPVASLMSSVPGLPARTSCTEGAAWQWDGVDFTVLNPPPGVASDHNNASCVLRVRSRHGTLLLPGDIESRAERRLVAAHGAELRADVLVAPHHGSRTSSAPFFLEAVRPRHVLYPVGYRNRYRHPHPSVTQRYAAMRAAAHNSPEEGAIELRLTAAGIAHRAYREAQRRYWFTAPRQDAATPES